MISHKQDVTTVIRKSWTLISEEEDRYSGTEPEVSRALTMARVSYSSENYPELPRSFGAIEVTVENGCIVVSYEIEERKDDNACPF